MIAAHYYLINTQIKNQVVAFDTIYYVESMGENKQVIGVYTIPC